MDPIADMLTLIRNAQSSGKDEVSFAFSRVKNDIAKILEKENFVEKAELEGRNIKRTIKITLKRRESGKDPAILGLKRISKPGQRIYKSFKEIRPIKSGYGIAIISTSKGLMTNKDARKQKSGGEVICEVW